MPLNWGFFDGYILGLKNLITNIGVFTYALVMNLKDLTSVELINVIESAGELFKLNTYKTKDYITKFLGLNIARANFYGLNEGGNITYLDKSHVVFDDSNDITIYIEGIVTLDYVPVNNGGGVIVYSGYGVLEVDGNLVYDGRSIIDSLDSVQAGLVENITTVSDRVADLEIKKENLDNRIENLEGEIIQLNGGLAHVINHDKNRIVNVTAFNSLDEEMNVYSKQDPNDTTYVLIKSDSPLVGYVHIF